jgi:hypothetical protein
MTDREINADDAHIEVLSDGTLWRFERRFLESNWTCIWGRGCKGILDHPAEHLQQGCCSVGAEMADVDEAMTLAASAAALDPQRWQHHAAVDEHDVFSDATATNTKVVDGACIFLNRVGFPGGEGCALHLAALDCGELAIDWKPSVCWQLPIKVDYAMQPDGIEHAEVRGWQRRDWGEEGATMHWCCTEGTEAYVGDQPVYLSLEHELSAVVGDEVYVQLRDRLRR